MSRKLAPEANRYVLNPFHAPPALVLRAHRPSPIPRRQNDGSVLSLVIVFFFRLYVLTSFPFDRILFVKNLRYAFRCPRSRR